MLFYRRVITRTSRDHHHLAPVLVVEGVLAPAGEDVRGNLGDIQLTLQTTGASRSQMGEQSRRERLVRNCWLFRSAAGGCRPLFTSMRLFVVRGRSRAGRRAAGQLAITQDFHRLIGMKLNPASPILTNSWSLPRQPLQVIQTHPLDRTSSCVSSTPCVIR